MSASTVLVLSGFSLALRLFVEAIALETDTLIDASLKAELPVVSVQ